jgi:hypothetical protein
MTGRNLIKHGFFMLGIAVCVLSSCAPPIGSIDGLGGGGKGVNSGFDALWVIPNRLFYEKGDIFNQADDLQIFTSDSGLVRQVDPSEPDVTITIYEISSFGDPINPTPVGPAPPYYTFPLPGIYFIEVGYNSKKARYTVEVRGYYVEPGDGSNFINIIWL